MHMKITEIYHEAFKIDSDLVKLAQDVEKKCSDVFERIKNISAYNHSKVIRAMQEYMVSDSHFVGTTGYGYNDRGREVLENVYAMAFGAEDALVRHQITCGTHALALCLYGILRPDDELLSITGKPYDTLDEVIGIRGEVGTGSLKDYGVTYRQVDLLENGDFDFEKIKESINPKTKMVFIQRSRGYSWRGPITVERIGQAVKFVKCIKPDVVVMVDNCYGEFVECKEPTDAGADIMAGSLIKNPGGGIALAGGYIAGRKDLVELVSYRMTVPGLGSKVGATLGQNRSMFQGFFLAPHIVAESLKGVVFASALMESLGYETCPAYNEERSDIIQAIKFGNPEAVIAFCQGIQKGSPVDSFVTPVPSEMPGYDSPVIMAAGAFVQGSSIELSADAPIRPPYIAYLQGGLVYEHVKLGVLCAAQELINRGLLRLG
ncbi:cystathionine beta-lyase [Thermoclostridium stercorarium subsp. stercorarium DSM 8532]|nr:cystathionine beta-lyase [Thermoclostridium stercorarium subsp. stercorarium DSM 8532]